MAFSARPSCTISRGPILPVEILLTIRSRSPICVSASRIISLCSGFRYRYSTTVCLFRMALTSLSGNAIHRCSNRPPIGVMVRSMMSYSVLLSCVCPLMSSRFRMVNRSSHTYRSSSMRLRCWICPVWRCCVISRYMRMPPAAVMAAGILSSPNPLSELTPHSFCSLSLAVDSTSIQSSSSKVKKWFPNSCSISFFLPLTKSTSLGAKLVSSLSMYVDSPCAARNSPVDISSNASPMVCLSKCRHATQLFSFCVSVVSE